MTGPQRRTLILRTAPPDDIHAGMELEAAVQAAAADAGAPVPHVLVASDSAAALGNPFLICDEIAGETIVRRIQRKLDDGGRRELLVQCAQALAAIHRAETTAPGLAEQDPLAQWREMLDAMADTTATFEWAFRWLAANRPAPSPTCLVHGDFRLGNLLVSPSGITGVLDWELTHRGDPAQDLGWLCTRAWRFGSAGRVGGIGDLGDLLRGYTDESGITVDAESVDWWQLFGSLHWAIICRQQAGRAGSGHDALELLAVGRRVAECEYDLLVELGLPMPASPPQAGDDDPDLFGEPTAADLLDAVGGFIAELADGASDRDRYRSKVAAHVLRIVARESQTGSAARTELGAHLARAGFETESGLALAIRDGSVDPGDADIAAAISTAVGLRLAVANPRYAS